MHKWLILLSALVTTLVSAAPAWRWVDESGTIHYSDRPVPGAVEVNLPDATPSRAASPRASAPTPSAAAEPAQSPAYTRFDIISPAQQETLWNTGGSINVEVAVTPSLQVGHRLALMLDGEQQSAIPTGTRFTLNEMYRGIHTVQAVIVDNNDAIVLQSLPTQFMVQQTSIQNPNNPNAN